MRVTLASVQDRILTSVVAYCNEAAPDTDRPARHFQLITPVQ